MSLCSCYYVPTMLLWCDVHTRDIKHSTWVFFGLRDLSVMSLCRKCERGFTKMGVCFMTMGVCFTKMGVCFMKMGVCFTKMEACFMKMEVCFTQMVVCFVKMGVCWPKQIGRFHFRSLYRKLRRGYTWRLYWRRSTRPFCQYLAHVSSDAKSLCSLH